MANWWYASIFMIECCCYVPKIYSTLWIADKRLPLRRLSKVNKIKQINIELNSELNSTSVDGPLALMLYAQLIVRKRFTVDIVSPRLEYTYHNYNEHIYCY